MIACEPMPKDAHIAPCDPVYLSIETYVRIVQGKNLKEWATAYVLRKGLIEPGQRIQWFEPKISLNEYVAFMQWDDVIRMSGRVLPDLIQEPRA